MLCCGASSSCRHHFHQFCHIVALSAMFCYCQLARAICIVKRSPVIAACKLLDMLLLQHGARTRAACSHNQSTAKAQPTAGCSASRPPSSRAASPTSTSSCTAWPACPGCRATPPPPPGCPAGPSAPADLISFLSGGELLCSIAAPAWPEPVKSAMCTQSALCYFLDHGPRGAGTWTLRLCTEDKP